MEYEKNIASYVEAVKTEFSQINEYNNKVISFGYVAFFAIATYVKDQSPRHIFLISIVCMSISIFVFVVHEICRSMYLSRYSARKSSAIDKFSDISIINKVSDAHAVSILKFQKYNVIFFWISSLFGLTGFFLMFCCYINIICK